MSTRLASGPGDVGGYGDWAVPRAFPDSRIRRIVAAVEHFKNETLGPRYALRLGDLSEGHVLQAVCLKCDRTEIVTSDALRSRFPDHTRLTDVEQRMRCRACGNAAGNRLRPGRMLTVG